VELTHEHRTILGKELAYDAIDNIALRKISCEGCPLEGVAEVRIKWDEPEMEENVVIVVNNYGVLFKEWCDVS
jgi:hypothetical protein